MKNAPKTIYLLIPGKEKIKDFEDLDEAEVYWDRTPDANQVIKYQIVKPKKLKK